jgi:hypothetical protein
MKPSYRLGLVLCICSLFFLSQLTYAQIGKAKNAVYLELGGNAFGYSLNYERIVYQQNMLQVGARIGVSLVPENTFFGIASYPIVPLEMIALFGKRTHHLETGIGVTPYVGYQYYVGAIGVDFLKEKLEAAVTFRLGYRYQKPNGGFMARVGIMPFLSSDGYLLPWAGISIGKSF